MAREAVGGTSGSNVITPNSSSLTATTLKIGNKGEREDKSCDVSHLHPLLDHGQQRGICREQDNSGIVTQTEKNKIQRSKAYLPPRMVG